MAGRSSARGGPGGASAVYYEYFATCPRPYDGGANTGCSVFMWNDVQHFFSFGPTFDLEAVLYDNDDMVFQYGPGNPEQGSGSTTGIENPAGDLSLTYACNAPGSITDNRAVWISSFVAFAEFVIEEAEVETEDDWDEEEGPEDEFEVEGSFELGASSNGIDPLNEDVTVVFGTFSQTIPAGSFFRDDDDEGFQFDGTLPGIKRMDIDDDFEFEVKGRDLDLSGVDQSSPVFFSIQIGKDRGETTISFDEEGEFELDNDDD